MAIEKRNMAWNPSPVMVRRDAGLQPYAGIIERWQRNTLEAERRLTGGRMSLSEFASGHEYFGLHHAKTGHVMREWAPNATRIELVGTFNNWSVTPGFRFANDQAASSRQESGSKQLIRANAVILLARCQSQKDVACERGFRSS